MSVSYQDWQLKPITIISKDMVERRHLELGSERGDAFANLSARTLRSVLNFATLKYENAKGISILSFNPVTRLSGNKQWFKVNPRTGHLKPHQFKAWFSAVLESESLVTRDYLQFVLMTGCRREEVASLLWSDVSLEDRSFFIRDPKNNRPMKLPLSHYLVYLLAERKNLCGNSIFVFPGEGATGHLVEPKRLVNRIGEKIDYHFTVHDLRRTFVTVAESLDIPQYSLKALVNHKSAEDVTGGYIQLSVERLRVPMQRITDFILESADIKTQSK
jgi:integrase